VALVAFANADGGELFVGVEDEGTITGIPHKNELILGMVNAPKTHAHGNTPLSGPNISRFMFEGVTILYFQIAKSTTRVHLTSVETVHWNYFTLEVFSLTQTSL
jgi:ATP-dependent DNA helicase RecG